MKSLGLRKSFTLGALAIMFLVALPVTSFGQGRGRWRNRGNQEWKSWKFVNGHDARDGRWDRRRHASIFRNDDYWRQRNVTIFRNNDYWRQRNRYYNGNYQYGRQRMLYPYSYVYRNRDLRNRDLNRRYSVRYRRW
ncbi:MAG TPA: hypothetical protein VN643_00635 [Pyrinomonadaceae bacterium]|nr:hypothetical protein [Pyrinomonadaceae bacterium]